MNKVKISDIARMAGVSPSAVSIALNNRPGISDKTREKILAIIEENNYIPNVNSRKLSIKKSFNIFVAADAEFTSFDDAFYNSVLMGIIARCRHYSYNAVLVDLTDDHDGMILKRAVDQKNVDGVIFLQRIRDVFLDVCRNASLPFAVVDTHEVKDNIPSVFYDYRSAAEKAADYLIAKGHRKIALLGLGEIPAFYDASYQGYAKALGRAGISIDMKDVLSVSVNKESISAVLGEYIRHTLPDGIICAGDLIAVYAMQYLNHTELTVPEHISVISFDNISLAELCCPTLTTVDIDKNRMGAESVDLVMDSILGYTDGSVQHRCIEVGGVVVRESVKEHTT